MGNSRPQQQLEQRLGRSQFERQLREANPGLPSYEEGLRELTDRAQNTATAPLFRSSQAKPLISWHTGDLGPGTSASGAIKTFGELDTQLPLVLVLAPPTVVDGVATPLIFRGRRGGTTPYLGIYAEVQMGQQQAWSTAEMDFGTGGMYNVSGGDIQITVYNDTDIWYPTLGPGGQDGFNVAIGLYLAIGVSRKHPHRTVPITRGAGTQITAANPLAPGTESNLIARPPMTAKITPAVISASPPTNFRLWMFDGAARKIQDYLISTDTPQEPIEMMDNVSIIQIHNSDAMVNITSAEAKFEVET
jgi:hypothetical protein